ncbi:MAG: IS256 family transposase [Candidatus Bathyarchaeia archaeon]
MFPVVIKSINQAFKVLKSFGAGEWEGDYRPAAQRALKEILETRMSNAVDEHIEQMRAQDIADRRNGSFSRHLLTELGDLELSVPRSRTFSAKAIVKKFARRVFPVERLIMLAFIFGLSTRKVGQALLPILGERISPTTVSRVAQQLDSAVWAYHQRKLFDHYQVLILDGLVIKRKTAIGTQRRTILVALGIRLDGKKEIIDFRQVFSEKQVHWEGFLNDLYVRGLKGENLKLIIGDGGKGLLAALPLVYGQVPFQRCWAHKVRNVLNYVRRVDQKEVKKDLHSISHARNLRLAQKAAQKFRERWERAYPKAVHCLKTDIDDLLTFLQVKTSLPHSALRTTNAIERRFREVRRRTRPMGVFSNHTSVERIIFSVFSYENLKENTATLFPILTQNN